jgi:CHAT domain-containing protein
MLMSEFYRIRQRNPGVTKAEAMQRAQMEMISGKLKASGTGSGCRSDAIDTGNGDSQGFRCDPNAPFSHPYFWSPFVLIGNWR